jgi:hypothetical protein
MRLTPGEWSVLVEAFAGLDSWMLLEEECDLIKAEVALSQARTNPLNPDQDVAYACAQVAYSMLTQPPTRIGNVTVTYEVLREMIARSRVEWYETPNERESWSGVARNVESHSASVRELSRWIAVRLRKGIQND